jgi:hypothetical protein
MTGAGRGVWRDLTDPDGVREAFAAIADSAPGDGVPAAAVVQPMLGGGVELEVGVLPEPSFGNLVRLAVGGPSAELIADEAHRTTPLTDVDASDLIRSLRTAPLIFDGRGGRPSDVSALQDLLLRVGRLVEELPEVVELLLDPVVLTRTGATAAGVRVRLAPWRPGPSWRCGDCAERAGPTGRPISPSGWTAPTLVRVGCPAHHQRRAGRRAGWSWRPSASRRRPTPWACTT